MPTNNNRWNILFVRHAPSCGNMVQYSNALFKQIRFQAKNPPLSDLAPASIDAAVHAQDDHGHTLRKALARVNHAATSDMLRALETSALLLPGQNIQVIPYANEIPLSRVFVWAGLDPQCESQGPSETQRALEVLGHDTSQIDWRMYRRVTQGRLPFADINMFWQKVVLDQWLNPESEFCLPIQDTPKAYTILVVTHGRFLRHLIDKCENYDTFYDQEPYFQPPDCPPARLGRRVIQNTGVVAMSDMTAEIVQDVLDGKRLFPRAERLYDSSVIRVNGRCVDLQSATGHRSWVSRCQAKVRDMPWPTQDPTLDLSAESKSSLAEE